MSCDPLFSLSGSVLAIQSGGKFPGDLTKPCLGRQCDDCYNMLTKPQGRFAAIVEALAHEQGVTVGSPGKKGFGSSALQVDGKIFAMVSSRGLSSSYQSTGWNRSKPRALASEIR